MCVGQGVRRVDEVERGRSGNGGAPGGGSEGLFPATTATARPLGLGPATSCDGRRRYTYLGKCVHTHSMAKGPLGRWKTGSIPFEGLALAW